MLDHHKTAAENLAGAAAPNLVVTVDMDRSGATIARDHFAPHGLTGAQQARPPLRLCARQPGGSGPMQLNPNLLPHVPDQIATMSSMLTLQ